MTKPWILCLLAAVYTLSLTNCASPAHAPDEKYYLVATNLKVPYWQDAAAGLNRAASAMQVKAEMAGPDNFDPNAEHQQFQDLIKSKPSGILVSVSDAKILGPDIDAAIAAGIPVITVDSDAPGSKRLEFIGTDNYKAGVMAAKVAVDKLGGKGNVIIYTMPTQENLIDRMRGYRDVLGSHPGIKIVETIDIKGDPGIAYDRTEKSIREKEKVDAFFCLEAIACPEVADVIERKQATGKVVVAMDTDERTLKAIQKGTITATVGQKPFTMAYVGVRALDDLHHHPLQNMSVDFSKDLFSPMPEFVDTGATLIDKSNVEQFLQARSAATAGNAPAKK